MLLARLAGADPTNTKLTAIILALFTAGLADLGFGLSELGAWAGGEQREGEQYEHSHKTPRDVSRACFAAPLDARPQDSNCIEASVVVSSEFYGWSLL